MNEDVIKTMRTSILTAYPKIYTDIPYSCELFYYATRFAVEYGFRFEPSLFVAEMAVEVEARHKALNRALQSIVTENDLIIELGAGLSPRRLEFQKYNYVEMDYLTITNLKRAIYDQMGLEKFCNGLIPIDFTQEQGFQRALSEVCKLKPHNRVVVVSEGLFWYLKREHVQNMLSAIMDLKENWIWVTADCPVKETSTAPYRNVIAKSSNKSPIEPFADFDDYNSFFNTHHCGIECYKLLHFVSSASIFSGKFFSIGDRTVKDRMDTYTDIAYIKEA